MKISCIQMDMLFGNRAENFARAEVLLEKTMQAAPDVIVLPELWDVGFFPKENLADCSDDMGSETRAFVGGLARRHKVNIVAGSVAVACGGKTHNTAMVFDRTGACIAEYDKCHLFSPMEEDKYFTPGKRLCTFFLDGVKCGIILCYDLRFPELTRSLALQGIDILFVPAQWPEARVEQWELLLAARAVENQVFTVGCNSCGTAGETRFGGNSRVFDPYGKPLAKAGDGEENLVAHCLPEALESARKAIPIFADRNAEIYKI